MNLIEQLAYERGYMDALKELIYEFESHDYYHEARMTRSFMQTSKYYKETPCTTQSTYQEQLLESINEKACTSE